MFTSSRLEMVGVRIALPLGAHSLRTSFGRRCWAIGIPPHADEGFRRQFIDVRRMVASAGRPADSGAYAGGQAPKPASPDRLSGCYDRVRDPEIARQTRSGVSGMS